MRTLYLSLLLAAFLPGAVFAMSSEPQVKNTTGDSKAIEIILQDHKKIEQLISELEKNLNSDIKQSKIKFNELKLFLENHEKMEQKVWYVELEKNADLKAIIDELKKEEDTASNELKQIDSLPNDNEWTAKVKKIIKDVKQHANNEETKLFPKVKQTLDKSTLDDLGNKLESYKNKAS